MNQEQYQFIQEKYGNLIYTIAQKINGDIAKCDPDDNVQDLWISALEAIKGYEAQDNGKNGKFEDFKNTQGFDKYIKTCLWHKKGKKGADVTKKRAITSTFSATSPNYSMQDEKLLLDVADPKFVNMNIADNVLEDIRVKLLPEEKLIVQNILQNPDCLKDNGRVNIAKLCRVTKLKVEEVRYYLEYIKSRYNMTMM
jgi:hypothetical protein